MLANNGVWNFKNFHDSDLVISSVKVTANRGRLTSCSWQWVNGMCWTVEMKTKLEVLFLHQVNCGNPSQENFMFVVFCQLHLQLLKIIRLLLTSKLQLWRWIECVERGGVNRDKFFDMQSVHINECRLATSFSSHPQWYPLLHFMCGSRTLRRITKLEICDKICYHHRQCIFS